MQPDQKRLHLLQTGVTRLQGSWATSQNTCSNLVTFQVLIHDNLQSTVKTGPSMLEV